MEKVFLKAISFVIFLILVSRVSYAISMGSIVKEDYAELTGGDSTKFKMLFWNIDNESYNLTLSIIDAPEGWITIIDPEEFALNRSVGDEYISLPYMDENIKAKVVNLFVKPSYETPSGVYNVVVEAGTETSDGENGIKVVPQRLLNFKVNLTSSSETGNIASNVSTIPSEDVSENEMTETTKDNLIPKEYFYLAVVLLVIAFSIILYKKS